MDQEYARIIKILPWNFPGDDFRDSPQKQSVQPVYFAMFKVLIAYQRRITSSR